MMITECFDGRGTALAMIGAIGIVMCGAAFPASAQDGGVKPACEVQLRAASAQIARYRGLIEQEQVDNDRLRQANTTLEQTLATCRNDGEAQNGTFAATVAQIDSELGKLEAIAERLVVSAGPVSKGQMGKP